MEVKIVDVAIVGGGVKVQMSDVVGLISKLIFSIFIHLPIIAAIIYVIF